MAIVISSVSEMAPCCLLLSNSMHTPPPQHPSINNPPPLPPSIPIHSSTGKPKGVLHTTGGYMIQAAATFKHVFNVRPEAKDLYLCTADCGWITGERRRGGREEG